jgi:CSLREA domain-containing protein
VPLRLIPPLVLVAFALGCSGGDLAAPTTPEAAMVKVPTVVVTSLLDDGAGACTTVKCTLRDAIGTAPAGADVTFAGNLCPRGATPATGCKITLVGVGLSISKNLRILGPVDNYKLAVDGGGVVDIVLDVPSAVFSAQPSGAVVTVRDLTISGSRLSGIQNLGTLTLRNVTVSGNGAGPADRGGGIHNGAEGCEGFCIGGGIITMSNSTVSGNVAFLGGGIYNGRLSTFTLTNSKVSGNTGPTGGGIMNDGGNFTLTGSTVSGNFGTSGGGIYNNGSQDGGTFAVNSSVVSGNTVRVGGGGIWNMTGTVTLTNSSVSGNAAAFDGNSFAGGIYTETGSLTLSGTKVNRNSADHHAGGILVNGSVTLKNQSCVNNNSVGATASSNPWSLVNIQFLLFGTVAGRNCGVVQP